MCTRGLGREKVNTPSSGSPNWRFHNVPAKDKRRNRFQDEDNSLFLKVKGLRQTVSNTPSARHWHTAKVTHCGRPRVRVACMTIAMTQLGAHSGWEQGCSDSLACLQDSETSVQVTPGTASWQSATQNQRTRIVSKNMLVLPLHCRNLRPDERGIFNCCLDLFDGACAKTTLSPGPRIDAYVVFLCASHYYHLFINCVLQWC